MNVDCRSASVAVSIMTAVLVLQAVVAPGITGTSFGDVITAGGTAFVSVVVLWIVDQSTDLVESSVGN